MLPDRQDVLEVGPDQGGNILEFIPEVNEGLADLEHSQGFFITVAAPILFEGWQILLFVLTYHTHCLKKQTNPPNYTP